MKINSELPLCMLSQNNEINEYDFVLFHLYISNESYKQYYLNQRKERHSRLMILDNSAYEFYVQGKELDLDAYMQVIKELAPDYYILPDVLMDRYKTLQKTIEFLIEYHSELGEMKKIPEPIAVAQGMTEEDLQYCLRFYSNAPQIKSICLPFHNAFYKDLGKNAMPIIKDGMLNIYPAITEDIEYAMGRISFIYRNKSLLCGFDHIHLLGSHCPLEKSFYKCLDWGSWNNMTMDTGYPVKCAVAGVELFKETKKPDIIIDDFLDRELDENTKNLIKKNVNKFREL